MNHNKMTTVIFWKPYQYKESDIGDSSASLKELERQFQVQYYYSFIFWQIFS